MNVPASDARRSINKYTTELRDCVLRFADDPDPFVRGLAATEVYRDQAELPVVVKRAEVCARAAERLRPVVLPQTRLLSCHYRRRRVHGGVNDENSWRVPAAFPERGGDWDHPAVPPAVREVLAFWREPRLGGRNVIRQEHSWLGRYGIANPHGWANGHTLPDHGILLTHGVDGLRAQIAARREQAVTPAQTNQLRAMDRCLEGLSNHAAGCAAAARETARGVDDPGLRERLSATADVAAAVAHAAPTTFHEALQLLLFSNFMDLLDNRGDAYSFSRADQLLLPFYAADRAAGRLDADEAFDLVCQFVARMWGEQTSMNLTLGGLTPAGDDGTNALSYMFLEAMEATELAVDLSVRLHADSPEDFRRLAARVIRRGFGRPSLYNDDVTVPALVRHGIDMADARDYAPLGCVEVMIPGRSAFRTMCFGMNLTKVLELVVNRGRCLITGDTVWDDVPAAYDSFQDLLDEYYRRIQAVVNLGVEIIREDERLESTVVPRPWLTVLSRGGIAAAVDLTAGQPKYDPVGVTTDGMADVANSLYAIRELVFDRDELSFHELQEVLRADWRGQENLRQRVLNKLPRFGQDDPAVNAVARDVAARFAGCFARHRTFYGGPFLPLIFGVSTSLIRGRAPKTGATASGRRAGGPLAMSLQAASAGRQGCTTELLRSITAIDFSDYAGGISNVQELDPSHYLGASGLERLIELIRTFFADGGMELSLNFHNEETLRAAQRDPERHQFLMVRLFGLSARFVTLSADVQEDVIQRVVTAAARAG